MNPTSGLLIAIAITSSSAWLASYFPEFGQASFRQKIAITILTLWFCFIFIGSVIKNQDVIFTLPILLASFPILLIDWLSQRIPNRITSCLAILQTLGALLNAIFEGSIGNFYTFVVSVIICLLFLILNLASKDQLGMGDVKLSYSLALGIATVTISLVPLWFLLVFTLGGIFAFALLLFRNANLNSTFAFGPFMLAAMWISIYSYNFL